MVGNGVVDINQTNYAWFEAGYSHSLVSEFTWRSMQRECDFTKDLGIDGNGCPQGKEGSGKVVIVVLLRWW